MPLSPSFFIDVNQGARDRIEGFTLENILREIDLLQITKTTVADGKKVIAVRANLT
jgi:hypothetical protein